MHVCAQRPSITATLFFEVLLKFVCFFGCSIVAYYVYEGPLVPRFCICLHVVCIVYVPNYFAKYVACWLFGTCWVSSSCHSGLDFGLCSKDCLWKTKVADGWSLATHQSSESSQVRVQPTRKDHSFLSMKTGVLLYNQNQRKVAKLMTHCAPNHHLDYKLIMMDKANLDFVGGELGTSPEHIKGVALLSNLRVSKKADEEFKAGEFESKPHQRGAAQNQPETICVLDRPT